MAGIQQAAKWMEEGKRVRRAHWMAHIHRPDHLWKIQLTYDGNIRPTENAYFGIDDLLADDWQIVTEDA